MKKTSIFLIILFAHLAFTGLAATYIGTDNNWFNPNNWDTGMVPDGSTDIVLNGNSQVLIDPALSPTGPIMVHNIALNNSAVLTLMDGTVFQYNQLDVNDTALLDAHSSQMSGDQLQLNTNTAAAGSFGIFFNPTTNDTRLIKIIARTPKVTMFLGGLIAASPGNTGMGHYATLLADDVELNGQLHIDTIYGFTPSVGDTFQIVTARNSMIGTFDNAREGDVVARFGQVNLVISYTGGDGNDVVLTAVNSIAGTASVIPTLNTLMLLVLMGLVLVVGVLGQRETVN